MFIIEVPDTFSDGLLQTNGVAEVQRWALETLVAQAVREGRISSGRAGEILGLSFMEREQFLRDRGVLRDYSVEELREQFSAAEQASRH